jgi:hypothetical protein
MDAMTRLTLKNGQWFDVKDKMKVRDNEFVHSFSYQGISNDGKTIHYNIIKHQISTLAVRTLAWSLVDEDGKVIHWPVGKNPHRERVDVIENLDGETFEEVSDLLAAHIKSLEPVTEKNETAGGEPNSTTTSPSAS